MAQARKMTSSDSHHRALHGMLAIAAVLLCIGPVFPSIGHHAAGSRGAPDSRAGFTGPLGSVPGPTAGSQGATAFTRSTPVPLASSGFTTFRGIGVGGTPWSTAYDSGAGLMYITNSQSGNVSVYSNTQGHVVANIPVGGAPSYIAYDSGKSEMFVSSDRNVTVISTVTRTVTATILLGGAPIGVAYDAGNGAVYVANYISNTVSVISDTTNSVTATIPAHNATGVVYDPGTSEIFVASLTSVSAIAHVEVIADATNRVVATIAVGIQPLALAYDPVTSRVYVPNAASNNVSVISDATNTVVASVPVGSGPFGVAYDSRSADVFVANSLNDNVSVISGATNTVVQSVGNYLGSGEVGVTYDPGIDAIFVADDNLNLVTMIIPGFNVDFTETGLPTGTQWIFNVTGSSVYGPTNLSVAGTLPSFLTRLPNGSYSFFITAVPNFVASPARGSFTVAGAALNEAITFHELFPVTFRETGLPGASDWSVRFNGTLNHSTTSSIGFVATNGSYPYLLGAVSGYRGSPSSGSVVVVGARSVPITFNATYAVTITETGLPSGTNWSVTFAGSASFSLTSAIAFTEVNGTYPYTLGGVPGWTTTSYTGAVTVSGAATTKVIAWAQATYTVTFAETGLPLGTSWSVTLNSVTVSGVGDLSFPGMANGTYTYTVGAVTGFSPNPGTASVKVSGPSSPISIVFQSTASSSTGSTFLGLPATEGYALLGGIILVVVGAGLALALRGRTPKTPPTAPPPSAGVPPATGTPPSAPP